MIPARMPTISRGCARRLLRGARARRPEGRSWLSLVAVWVALVGAFVAGTPATRGGAATAGGITPVTRASTSNRGVAAHSINVVFPVANLEALSGQFGFATDEEYKEQVKAIDLFVQHVNATGGINGRMINAMIKGFDPTNDAQLQALCTDWTQGNPPVFAVLDGLGTWSGPAQLCITQQGHTPFLAQWTTVSNWTTSGSPYLWWTGPDDAAILRAVVSWGHSAGLLGGSRKVGVLAGDRATDQLALTQYLLPDLKKIGVKPLVVTMPAQPSETAATTSAAQLAVERFKAAGVNSLIPLIPFQRHVPGPGRSD
jgi:hypothetical protein